MIMQCLLLPVGLLLAVAVLGDDAIREDDLARLQGTWTTLSLVNDGKTLVDKRTLPKAGPDTKLVYEGRGG